MTALVSLVPTLARADVVQFPKRPEWDDVPVPMPPELWLLSVLALVAVAVVLTRAWRSPS